MGYTIKDLQIDSSQFTLSDMKNALNHIFGSESKDFEELKSQKWYHDLLRAVTFHSDDRKRMIADITSLARLQQLLVQLYAQYYEALDDKQNRTLSLISGLNDTAKRLYTACVMKLELQKDIEDFDRNEAAVLQLFLGEYRSQNHKEEDFKKYRGSVVPFYGNTSPMNKFDEEQLQYVQHPEVFYRCACELCALDGCLENEGFPERVRAMLEHLAVAPAKRRTIKEAVLQQAQTLGLNYFIDGKYGVNPLAFDMEGIETQEYSEELCDYQPELSAAPKIRQLSDMKIYIAPPKQPKEKKSADLLKDMLKNEGCRLSDDPDGCNHYIYFPSSKGADNAQKLATKPLCENEYGCTIFCPDGDSRAFLYLSYAPVKDIDNDWRESLVAAYQECRVKNVKESALQYWREHHIPKDTSEHISHKLNSKVDSASDAAKKFAVGVMKAETKKVPAVGKKIGGGALFATSLIGQGIGKAVSGVGAVIETAGDKGISKVSNDHFDKEILPAIQCDFLASDLLSLLKTGDL